MDYVNIAMPSEPIAGINAVHAVGKQQMKKKKYDLFIAIKVNCNLFSRSKLVRITWLPCRTHAVHGLLGACLSIASPLAEMKKKKVDKKPFHFVRVCTTAKSNVYNKLNCKWHKISWPSSRRRSDRSQCTCFSSSFSSSLSSFIHFPIPLIFIANNDAEKKFQKCDVIKLRRLKGRARISCAFMMKEI